MFSAAGPQSRPRFELVLVFLSEARWPIHFSCAQKLASEVSDYGEARGAVEDRARRLSELSRKEDCDVIHNLMMIVQDRHKKLQLRVAERGRILEEVKKNAKQVHV